LQSCLSPGLSPVEKRVRLYNGCTKTGLSLILK
jgi:hypothetical protein